MYGLSTLSCNQNKEGKKVKTCNPIKDPFLIDPKDKSKVICMKVFLHLIIEPHTNQVNKVHYQIE